MMCLCFQERRPALNATVAEIELKKRGEVRMTKEAGETLLTY